MAVYAEDQLKATSWLALNAGVRQTYFSGGGKRHQPALRSLASHSEIKLGLPRVLRPLLSSAPFAHRLRPLLQLATSQNLGFVPLWRARRGTPIRRHHPSSRLDTDADNFLTRANNFFDHNNFNNSEIFIPITIEGARVSGWELTLTASAQPWSDVPEVLKSARARLRWHQRRPHGLFFWRRLRVVGPRPAQHAPRGRPVLFPVACFCLHRSPTPPASATAINRR